MKILKFNLSNSLLNVYKECIHNILIHNLIKDKNKVIDNLNNDFNELMKEIKDTKSLKKVSLKKHYVITTYCNWKELSELIDNIRK